MVRWGDVMGQSRRAIGALMLGAALVVACGCTSSVNGAGQVDAVGASQYRADRSSSEAREQQTAVAEAEYGLCATVTTSVVSMLRTYNTFVTALNAKQAYADLGGADRRAVDGFTRGSSAISTALTSTVSDALRSDVQQLIDRTGALSRAVGGRQRAPLNAASIAWIRARDVVLGSCGPYASSNPSTSSAVPTSPSPSPGG